MRRKLHIAVILNLSLVWLIVAQGISLGAIYYISVTGDNSNPGTIEKPFRTIQKGVQVASSGDTILVGPGTYHEAIVINTQNLTLQGLDQNNPPVLDGADQSFNPTWTLVSGHIYKTSYRWHRRKLTDDEFCSYVGGLTEDKVAMQVYEDGQLLRGYNKGYFRNLGDLDPKNDSWLLPHDWMKQNISIPGRFLYDENAGVLYVWCSDEGDPKNHSYAITVIFRLIDITAPGVSLRNLVIKHAEGFAVRLYQAHNSVIEDCFFINNMYPIWSKDSDDVKIRRNFIQQKGFWEKYWYYDTKGTILWAHAIRIDGGMRARVSENVISGFYSGVHILGGDCEIHDNIMSKTMSTHVDPYYYEQNFYFNLKVYHNIFHHVDDNSMGISQIISGPIWIYRNLFYHCTYLHKDGGYTYEGTLGKKYLYHNTFAFFKSIVNQPYVNPPGKNTIYRNNIFYPKYRSIYETYWQYDKGLSSSVCPDSDYNLFWEVHPDDDKEMAIFGGKIYRPGEFHLMQQETGLDVHGFEADPEFANKQQFFDLDVKTLNFDTFSDMDYQEVIGKYKSLFNYHFKRQFDLFDLSDNSPALNRGEILPTEWPDIVKVTDGKPDIGAKEYGPSENRPPVLDPIGNRSLDEGALLEFMISATDPDGDSLTYSASNLPQGASFNGSTRIFSWRPAYDQAGIYNNVHFAVSDGELTDSEDITITVNNVNRAPVLDPIGDKSVNEGQTLNFTVSGSDADGDSLTYSASNLPQGANFDAGSRTFSWTPTYQQAGTYPNVYFEVTDGSLSDSEDITITVNNVTGPLVLDPIGNKSIDENTLLTFTVNATDPEGESLTYSASNLPTGASFDTATKIFNWTPAYDQAGIYPNVHFEVSDGTATDSEDITITVNNVNRAPILNAIGNKSVNEAQNLSFTVSGSDPDGDNLTYSASNLPQGTGFNAGSRTFSWTPAYDQAGTYNNVHFEVSDGTVTDSEDITITVNNVNRPPILNAIGNKSINEGQTLSFTVSGSDPDGDNLTYSASNLPQGASFNTATKTFNWTPAYDQAGIYPNVHFEVSDGTATDSEDITITVNNVNRPPILNAIGNKSVNEAQNLSFTVSGSDPDGDNLTYSAFNLPQGASFNTATKTFTWIPAYDQASTYPNLHFEVTDGSLSDSEDIIITVNNVNRAPLLESIGNKSISLNETLTFTVNATDPDGDPITYSVQSLPDGAIFENQTFTWTPIASDVGDHWVTFIASDGSLSDSEKIVITVKEDEKITLKIRFNTDRVSKIGILYISGETNEGAVIKEVKMLDEYNKILDIDIKDNVSITGERYITGIVIVGDIIKKYPLVSGIKIRIKVAKGEKTKEGETGVARIEPYGAGPDRIGVYNNVFNPLKGEKAVIKIDTTEQTHIKINLYDTKGKKIKEIADEERGVEICRYYWDGKDGSGNIVGSGLYLVHIEAGDYKKTKKIVVVK